MFASPQLFIVFLNRIKIVCLVLLDGKSLVDCDTIWSSGLLVWSWTFSHHVTEATQQAPGRLRGPYRCRSVLPEDAKLNWTRFCCFSVFYHYHCYPAYGNSISGEDYGNIQKLQSTDFVYVSKITYLPFELPYICHRMDVASEYRPVVW